MANYLEHVRQAKSNLEILVHTNKTKNDGWDWQVTMCFYTAVHLINAHLASKRNLHYRSHGQVNEAINPYKTVFTNTELSQGDYLAYIKLQNLSRRFRYLCLDSDHIPPGDPANHATYDKHLKKALVQLDKLLIFINAEYNEPFSNYAIDCIEIQKNTFKYFTYQKRP